MPDTLCAPHLLGTHGCRYWSFRMVPRVQYPQPRVHYPTYQNRIPSLFDFVTHPLIPSHAYAPRSV